jgi:hypothetical protein
MRESLMAFIGPTYTGFHGEFAALDLADPVDLLCKKEFGTLVFQLTVKKRDDRAQVRRLLTKLVDFLDRQSTRSFTHVKPIGRLLRDLEMAIVANNEVTAWSTYSDIRNRGRLSATNLAFLQVRIHSAFELWDKIVLLPNLNDLLNIRRPKQISEQIARAVYQYYFMTHQIADDANGAVNTYRNIGYRFQNLIRSTEGFRSPDTIKLAIISAVSANPPKRDLAEQLLKNPAISSDLSWAQSLLATLPPQATTHLIAESTPGQGEADLKYNENRFDEALALYLKEPQTHRSVTRVLEIAVEVDTIPSAEVALAYLSKAPNEIRERVLNRRVFQNHIETLTRICGLGSNGQEKAICSFNAWFDYVDSCESPEAAIELLEYGINDWNSNLLPEATLVARQLQKSRTGKRAEIIRNAVPTFIRALLIDETPKREYKAVYTALVELLIYDGSTGTDDLTAIEQLLEAILTTAPSLKFGENDFTFATDATVYLWNLIAGPRHFNWALSMLDLLIDTGAFRHTNLAPVLASIVNLSQSWARRISREQWSLLQLLATDLDLSDMVPAFRSETDAISEKPVSDFRSLFLGKSIAIYSMTERIAKRAQQLIQQAFEGVIVHLLHDKCCTDRMKSLAQNVDIFLVNTWDAKHAATNGIKHNRPGSMTTLEPRSKSPAALLAALMSFSANPQRN